MSGIRKGFARIGVCIVTTVLIFCALFSAFNFSSFIDGQDKQSTEASSSVFDLSNAYSFSNLEGGSPGEGRVIDLTSNSGTPSASDLNGTLREYYINAGEVIEDVFLVTDSCYFWDPMPSADVIGIFNRYAQGDKHEFKFYGRLQGNTSGILKYARPANDTLEWYQIKINFYVNDTHLSNKPSGPQSKFHDAYVFTDSMVFNVDDIAEGRDPVILEAKKTNPLLKEKLKILAASVFYPVASDASAYASADMGFDLNITPKLGTNINLGLDSITLKIHNNQYLSFGVEFLIESEAGWRSIVYAYVNEGIENDVTMNQPSAVEMRTTISSNTQYAGYSVNGYPARIDEATGSLIDSNPIIYSNYTTHLDYGQSNYHHNLSNKTNDGKSMNVSIPSGNPPVGFDVILQGSWTEKVYNQDAYVYCSKCGPSARASLDRFSQTHIISGQAGYRCQWYGMSGAEGRHNGVSTTAGQHISTLDARKYCVGGHIKMPDTLPSDLCWCGLALKDFNRPVYGDCHYMFYNDGAGCTYDTKVLSAFDTVLNFHQLPFYLSLGVENVGENIFFPKSKGGATVQLTGTETLEFTLRGLDDNLKLFGAPTTLVYEAFGNYAEIENIYSYDKAYMGVTLQTNGRNSKIKIVPIKNTPDNSPKYVVFTVTNVIDGVRYRSLVSYSVQIRGLASPTTNNLEYRTNQNPNAKTATTVDELGLTIPGGDSHTFNEQRGFEKPFTASLLAEDIDGDILGFSERSTDIVFQSVENGVGVVGDANTYLKVKRMVPVSEYPNYFNYHHSKVIYLTALLPMVNKPYYLKVYDHNGGYTFVPITVTARNNRPDKNPDENMLTFEGLKNEVITLNVGKIHGNKSIAIDPDDDEVEFYRGLTGQSDIVFMDASGTDNNVDEFISYVLVADDVLEIRLEKLRRKTLYYIKVMDEHNSSVSGFEDGIQYIPVSIRCYNDNPQVADEVNISDSSGGSRSYFGYRGMEKIFFAQRGISNSVAIDINGDEIDFESDGSPILFDDPDGIRTSDANDYFTVTRVGQHQVRLVAKKTFSERTFYLKVVDENWGTYTEIDGNDEFTVMTGISYIPIRCSSKNKLPEFSQEFKNYNVQGSYLTIAGTTDPNAITNKALYAESWTITLKDMTAPKLTGNIAKDDDRYPPEEGTGRTQDLLGLKIINWSDQGNFIGYILQDPIVIKGETYYQTIYFYAIKRTSGRSVTICAYDGNDTVIQNIVIVVQNSQVIQTKQFDDFQGMRGYSANYSAKLISGITTDNYAVDFDGDDFRISEIRCTGSNGREEYYIMEGEEPTGYVQCSLVNGLLNILAIAKSSRHPQYFGTGDFMLEVRIRDDGDVQTGGVWAPITVQVFNTPPVARDKTVDTITVLGNTVNIKSGDNIPLISPHDLADEYDYITMGFPIGSSDNYLADNLSFDGSIDLSQIPSYYADIYYCNASGVRTTTPDESSFLKIVPKKWTPVERVFYVVIIDRSYTQTVDNLTDNNTVRVKVTLKIDNTAPIHRDVSKGTELNKIPVNLTFYQDASEPLPQNTYLKEFTFSPYTYVKDIDLQDTLYQENPDINISTGKPNSLNADTDSLIFGSTGNSAEFSLSGNSMGFIEYQIIDGMLFKITAVQRNTAQQDKNLIMSIAIKDEVGNICTIWFIINVLNSRPHLIPDQALVTNKVMVRPTEVNDPPVTLEWTADLLTRDLDPGLTSVVALDKPEFIQSSVVVVFDNTLTGDALLGTANLASAYVRAGVRVSTSPAFNGKTVLYATAQRMTASLNGGIVYVGFKVNDRSQFEAKDSLYLWIRVQVLNSIIYQPESSYVYTMNGVSDTFNVMVRAYDEVVKASSDENVTRVTVNNVTYTVGDPASPLIIIATDPDTPETNPIFLRETNGAKYTTEPLGKTVTQIFDAETSTATIGAKNWYFLLTFKELGQCQFTLTLDDAYAPSEQFTIKFVKTSVEYTIDPIVVTLQTDYKESNIDNLKAYDLYDFITLKAQSDFAFARLAKNEPAEFFEDDKWYEQTEQGGQSLHALNSSITIPAGAERFFQILGGRKQFDGSDSNIPQADKDRDKEGHYSQIVFRGLQRTYTPIEITININVFDGTGFVDYDSQPVAEEDFDALTYVFAVKVKVVVENSALLDTNPSVQGTEEIWFNTLSEFTTGSATVQFTSTTERATISASPMEGTNLLVLNLEDDDLLDNKLISWKSILVGSKMSDTGGNEVQEGEGGAIHRYRQYDNLNFSFTGGVKSFEEFFDIVNPNDPLAKVTDETDVPDSSYIYIRPKKKTDVLGGYFPLYFMVYDDFEGSSRGRGKNGTNITQNEIIRGSSNINGVVSRAIVCVRIYIANSAPVAKSSHRVYTMAKDEVRSLQLSDLFTDADMIYYEYDNTFFDMKPDISVDTIREITIQPIGDAENYISISVGKYSVEDSEIPDYTKPDCQKITFEIINNPLILSEGDTRIREFIITIFDNQGKFCTILISVYIPNTPPRQTSEDREFKMNLNQTVEFSLDRPRSYNDEATASNKGVILSARDSETLNSELLIEELSINQYSAFSVKYAEFLLISKIDDRNLSITALKPTAKNQPLVFEFRVNDGDFEYNLVTCTYKITINSSPPTLRPGTGFPNAVDEAFGVKLNQSRTILMSDIVQNPNSGDVLRVASKPIGTGASSTLTRFTNDQVVDSRFLGMADYLINGVNTNQNNYISVAYSSSPEAIVVTARNVYGSEEVSGRYTIRFYVVNSGFSAVQVDLKIVVENEIITLNDEERQSVTLGGVGASKTISLNDYYKSEDGSAGDKDFENPNTQYSVSIYESRDEERIEIASYTVKDGFRALGKVEGTEYYKHFEIPEIAGINSGRYLTFTSIKRTASPIDLDIEIVKLAWRVDSAKTGSVIQEVMLSLRYSVVVENTAPTVINDNLPVIMDGKSSRVNLKIGETATLPLFGNLAQSYLMQDLDNDALVMNYNQDAYVENDTVVNDFKKCLEVTISAGNLVIKAINKMFDVDKTGFDYVTRNVCLKIFDEAGAPSNTYLVIPVTITNSAPVALKTASSFTVYKDKAVTTEIDGETVPRILLSSLIYDADFYSNNESFSISGELDEARATNGLDLKSITNSNDIVANIKVSQDFKTITIVGKSNTRNATCATLRFTVSDGSGKTTEQMTISITVGNTAPEPINGGVFNIQGGAKSKTRAIFLNKSDHDIYYQNRPRVEFVELFTDINGDTFQYSNYLVDIIVNPDNPIIKIEINGDILTKGFIISTIPGMRGTTSVSVRAYDSDPNNPTKGTLSASVEITINVSEDPLNLETKTLPLFNQRTRGITPQDVYGLDEQENDLTVGFTFLNDTLKVVEQASNLPATVTRYTEIIEIREGLIFGKRQGAAMVSIELIIGEDIYLVEVDVLVERNYPPQLRSSMLNIDASELIYEDGKSPYVYLDASRFVRDIEEDELVLKNVVSSNNYIVEPVMEIENNRVKLICKAKGEVELEITIEDAVNPYKYKIQYSNTYLPGLGFFGSIASEVSQNPTEYVTGLILFLLMSIAVVIVLSAIRHKRNMRAEVEAIMVQELKVEEQLLLFAARQNGLGSDLLELESGDAVLNKLMLGTADSDAKVMIGSEGEKLLISSGKDEEGEKLTALPVAKKHGELRAVEDLGYDEFTYYSHDQLELSVEAHKTALEINLVDAVNEVQKVAKEVEENTLKKSFGRMAKSILSKFKKDKPDASKSEDELSKDEKLAIKKVLDDDSEEFVISENMPEEDKPKAQAKEEPKEPKEIDEDTAKLIEESVKAIEENAEKLNQSIVMMSVDGDKADKKTTNNEVAQNMKLDKEQETVEEQGVSLDNEPLEISDAEESSVSEKTDEGKTETHKAKTELPNTNKNDNSENPEAPKEEMKAKPVETPKEEIKAKPVETPKEEIKAKPVETPKEEINAKPAEAPKEEVKAKPVEAPKEEIKAKTAEAPKEEVKAKPAEAPKEEVKAKPVETPKEEINAKPVETPKEEINAKPVETPKEEVKAKATEAPKEEIKAKATEAPKEEINAKPVETPKEEVEVKAKETAKTEKAVPPKTEIKAEPIKEDAKSEPPKEEKKAVISERISRARPLPLRGDRNTSQANKAEATKEQKAETDQKSIPPLNDKEALAVAEVAGTEDD